MTGRQRCERRPKLRAAREAGREVVASAGDARPAHYCAAGAEGKQIDRASFSSALSCTDSKMEWVSTAVNPRVAEAGKRRAKASPVCQANSTAAILQRCKVTRIHGSVNAREVYCTTISCARSTDGEPCANRRDRRTDKVGAGTRQAASWSKLNSVSDNWQWHRRRRVGRDVWHRSQKQKQQQRRWRRRRRTAPPRATKRLHASPRAKFLAGGERGRRCSRWYVCRPRRAKGSVTVTDTRFGVQKEELAFKLVLLACFL